MLGLLLALVSTQVPAGVDLIGDAPMRLSLGTIASGQARLGSAEITIKKRGENAYSAEMKSPAFRLDLHKGEVVYVTYQARGPASKHESGTAFWGVQFQRTTSPWDGFGSTSASAAKDWRTFHHAFRVDKDYPAGQTEMTMHVGAVEQTIEVKGLKAVLLPPETDMAKLPTTLLTYEGRDPKARWRAKAAAMIEKNRKGNLEIVVTRNGKPVQNEVVRFSMTRHAYPFGTFAEYHYGRTDADSVRYNRLLTTKLFSRITVPVYWADWGWENPKTRAEWIGQIEWAEKLGLRMKAHNLLWPSDKWLPARVRPMRGNELRNAMSEALNDRLAALKGKPFENIDVVNELRTERDVYDRVGLSPIVDYFRKTRAAYPKAELVYNDYATFEGAAGGGQGFLLSLEWTKRLLAAKAPVTLSGWQGHFGEDLTPPEKVWALIDKWKKQTGLPLEITEFDINTRDERAQADYTRDLLTAWFAHPQTKGFTMWGFWEGSHWIPNGAMYRKDWSRKPNADAYENLVNKAWWTDVTVRTDARGRAKVRGFQGDYEVAIGRAKVKAQIKPGSSTVGITLYTRSQMALRSDLHRAERVPTR